MPGIVAIAADDAGACASEGTGRAKTISASARAMRGADFTKGFRREQRTLCDQAASERDDTSENASAAVRCADRFDRPADDRVDAKLSERCRCAARIAVHAVRCVELPAARELVLAHE